MIHGPRQTGRAQATAALLASLLALAAWALPAQTAPARMAAAGDAATVTLADPADPADAAEPANEADLAALTALAASADLSALEDSRPAAEPGPATGPEPAADPGFAAAVTPPAFPATTTLPTLVVNEVLADPATDWDGDGAVDAKGDEWIEVRNLGTVPVDLGDYGLRDSSGEAPDLRLSGWADPGEQVVFHGSAAVAWQAANGLSTTGFALNNTGDSISLLRVVPGTSPAQYEVIHSVAIADHEAEDDRSSGYDVNQTAWLLFDALNPYPGAQTPVGSGCAPSPGADNLCGGQVATETATFGEVKATYR